jgi:CO dehydrogenase maturation factor
MTTATIAVAGKGGTGKTTISGVLSRGLARRGHRVWAIDADSNPSLALALGLSKEASDKLLPLPRAVLKEGRDEEGRRRLELGMPAAAVAEQYGVTGPDGVTLMLMGQVEHAGAGCMCRAHAAARQLIHGLLEEEGVVAIVDMEAGLEHLSRGTDRHVQTLLVLLEPYFKALETARRIVELARELGIPRIVGVANKLRDEQDRAAVADYARAHEIEIIAEVPFDDALRRVDREGRAPIDVGGASVKAILSVATALQL